MEVITDKLTIDQLDCSHVTEFTVYDLCGEFMEFSEFEIKYPEKALKFKRDILECQNYYKGVK